MSLIFPSTVHNDSTSISHSLNKRRQVQSTGVIQGIIYSIYRLPPVSFTWRVVERHTSNSQDDLPRYPGVFYPWPEFHPQVRGVLLLSLIKPSLLAPPLSCTCPPLPIFTYRTVLWPVSIRPISLTLHPVDPFWSLRHSKLEVWPPMSSGSYPKFVDSLY